MADDRSGDFHGTSFRDADFSRARFRNVDLTDVKMVDAVLLNADLSGLIDGLRVNGIEVAPLIVEEMKRLYPDREGLFHRDSAGLHDAWSSVESFWSATVRRAQGLPESMLHARVDEEWSFIETLRHLVFVTDAWIGRVVFGDEHPYHPYGLPPSFISDVGALATLDTRADPGLDEVIEVRAGRMQSVRDFLDRVSDADLDRMCSPPDAPGYPDSGRYGLVDCILTVIDEEWWHHRFAVRDLDVLSNAQ